MNKYSYERIVSTTSEQYSEINTDTLERVTEIFKALGDYNRIRIMELLSVSEASVGHISHQLNLSQSNVSTIKIT